MKILVAFYSRNGHTKKVGERIAKLLKADVEEIKDKKDRSHIKGWMNNAFDEELRTSTKIEKPVFNSFDYDLVIIGGPIWDGVCPAIRAYLKNNRFKRVAFYATFGAASDDAFYVMEKLSNKKPIGTLEMQDREISLDEHDYKIMEFCKKIKGK